MISLNFILNFVNKSIILMNIFHVSPKIWLSNLVLNAKQHCPKNYSILYGVTRKLLDIYAISTTTTKCLHRADSYAPFPLYNITSLCDLARSRKIMYTEVFALYRSYSQTQDGVSNKNMFLVQFRYHFRCATYRYGTVEQKVVCAIIDPGVIKLPTSYN